MHVSINIYPFYGKKISKFSWYDSSLILSFRFAIQILYEFGKKTLKLSWYDLLFILDVSVRLLQGGIN